MKYRNRKGADELAQRPEGITKRERIYTKNTALQNRVDVERRFEKVTALLASRLLMRVTV